MNPDLLRRMGYSVFTNGELNICAERKFPYAPNRFNDLLHVFYIKNARVAEHQFPITTMPGAYYLSNLLNPKGTAILKEGQYFNAYKMGQHKGKPALIQSRPVTVYRDKNRDEFFDLNNEETGMFGINIHRAGSFSHFINSWSAGCQVFQKELDFEFFMMLCESTKKICNGLFTYTLIEESYL